MRRLLRSLHQIVGLTLAPLLTLQALSGVAWAFQEPLDALAHPARATGGPGASLDVVLETVAQSAPDARLDRIVYPDHAGRPLVVRLQRPSGMAVMMIDPGSGHLLASGPLAAFPGEFAERLHGNLFLGPAGRLILVVEAAGLVFMVAAGLVLWGPRLARPRQALVVTWPAPLPRLSRDLHGLTGFAASAILLLLGLTALGLTLEPQLRAAVAPPPSAAEAAAPLPVLLTTRLPAQTALEDLQARVPNGRLIKVRTSGPGSRTVLAVFRDLTQPNPLAVRALSLDRDSGAIASVLDPSGQGPGDAALGWLPPLHTAALMGPARAAAEALTALVLLTLMGSGVVAWGLRRHKTAPLWKNRPCST
jgi:uncharacterized iron-regulated membrane protein